MFVRCIFLKGKWHRIAVNKLERLLTLIHKIHQTIATRKIIAISKTIDSQVYKVVILLVKEIMMVEDSMVKSNSIKKVIIIKSHIIKKVINLKDTMVKKINRFKLLLTLVRPLLSLYQMIIQTIDQRMDLMYMLKMARSKNLIIRRKITRMIIKHLRNKYLHKNSIEKNKKKILYYKTNTNIEM